MGINRSTASSDVADMEMALPSVGRYTSAASAYVVNALALPSVELNRSAASASLNAALPSVNVSAASAYLSGLKPALVLPGGLNASAASAYVVNALALPSVSLNRSAASAFASLEAALGLPSASNATATSAFASLEGMLGLPPASNATAASAFASLEGMLGLPSASNATAISPYQYATDMENAMLAEGNAVLASINRTHVSDMEAMCFDEIRKDLRISIGQRNGWSDVLDFGLLDKVLVLTRFIANCKQITTACVGAFTDDECTKAASIAHSEITLATERVHSAAVVVNETTAWTVAALPPVFGLPHRLARAAKPVKTVLFAIGAIDVSGLEGVTGCPELNEYMAAQCAKPPLPYQVILAALAAGLLVLILVGYCCSFCCVGCFHVAKCHLGCCCAGCGCGPLWPGCCFDSCRKPDLPKPSMDYVTNLRISALRPTRPGPLAAML